MVLQAFIIVGLLSTVLLIGYKQQRDTENMDRNIKLAARLYIADKKLKPSFKKPVVIFKDDLNETYIFGDNFDDYCMENIVVSKGLFKVEYKINKCVTE